MAYIYPKRYNFENETVDVDPRDNHVVSVEPRRYTEPSVQPQGQVLGAFVDNRGNATPPGATASPSQSNAGRSLDQLLTDEFQSTQPAAVDENAIREQTRKNMQAHLDSINAYFGDLIQREQQAGNARLDKVRALNVNSGLSGSNFASSADLEQRGLNDKSTKAVENERNLRLQEVHGRIDEIARADIAAKKAEAKGQADAYGTFLEKKRGEAKQVFSELAGAGVDWDTLDQKRKSYLSKLLGYEDDTVGLVFNSLKPKKDQIDYQYIKEAGAFVGVNPATGELSQLKIEGAGPDADLVLDMIKKYPDASISLQDDIATATQKIQSSRIYQKDVRVPGPTRTPSPNGTPTPNGTPMPSPDGSPTTLSPLAQMAMNDPTILDGLTATQRGQVLNEIATSGQQLPNAKQETLSKLAQDALGTINTLESHGGLKGAVGAKGISSFFGLKGKPVSGTAASDFTAYIDTLKSQLTLPNLQYLRGLGAMSDREFTAISNSVTALNRDMSEKQFKEELGRLKTALQEISSKSTQQQGTIRVRQKASGQTGTIPAGEFDPNLYEKL